MTAWADGEARDPHGRVEEEALGEHRDQVVSTRVELPQVVGEADDVERVEDLLEARERRDAGEDDQAYRQEAAVLQVSWEPGREGAPAEGQPGDDERGDVQRREHLDGVDALDEPLHVPSCAVSRVVEEAPQDAADEDADVDELVVVVEVVPDLLPAEISSGRSMPVRDGMSYLSKPLLYSHGQLTMSRTLVEIRKSGTTTTNSTTATTLSAVLARDSAGSVSSSAMRGV